MIVELKQYADQSAASVGLDKYNRSKLPGTFEVVYPVRGRDGRFVTGIDEDAASINSIADSELRRLKKEETLKLRKELEALSNIDLRATNEAFWSNFGVSLVDNFALDLSLAKDKIKYHVLIANGYAAPELGVINSPEYINTKYYVSRKEEEASSRMVSTKTKDQARSELLALSKNYDKMILIAKFLLGVRAIKDGMDDGIVYEELSKFIDNPKEKGNITLFLAAVGKTIDELQYKLTVDEAIRKSIIKVREGYFQRGNATYGKTLQETLDYLSSVENSAEFASLKEEVDKS